MQISSTPTAYGGGEAQRLLNMILQPQAPPAGQDLPSTDSSAATATATPTPAATPTTATSADQVATDTLSSLLSAQEAPPSPADVAQ